MSEFAGRNICRPPQPRNGKNPDASLAWHSGMPRRFAIAFFYGTRASTPRLVLRGAAAGGAASPVLVFAALPSNVVDNAGIADQYF
jgi:hypothetical protein